MKEKINILESVKYTNTTCLIGCQEEGMNQVFILGPGTETVSTYELFWLLKWLCLLTRWRGWGRERLNDCSQVGNWWYLDLSEVLNSLPVGAAFAQPGETQALWKWKWNSLSHVRLFVTPWTVACHEDSPGQNTGVGNCSLPKGIFPTQGSNPGLLHCRQILYCLSHQGRLGTVEPHAKSPHLPFALGALIKTSGPACFRGHPNGFIFPVSKESWSLS